MYCRKCGNVACNGRQCKQLPTVPQDEWEEWSEVEREMMRGKVRILPNGLRKGWALLQKRRTEKRST